MSKTSTVELEIREEEVIGIKVGGQKLPLKQPIKMEGSLKELVSNYIKLNELINMSDLIENKPEPKIEPSHPKPKKDPEVTEKILKEAKGMGWNELMKNYRSVGFCKRIKDELVKRGWYRYKTAKPISPLRLPMGMPNTRKNWIRYKLWNEGLTDREMADKLKVKRGTISIWRNRFRLDVNDMAKDGVSLPAGMLNNRKNREKYELYKQGKTDKQIAETLGLNKKTICNWRKRNNLEVNRSKRKGNIGINWKKHNEKMKLWNEGLTDGEIAKKLNISKGRVRQWRYKHQLIANKKKITKYKRFGEELRDVEVAKKEPSSPLPNNMPNTEINRLRMKLYNQGLTDQEIADKVKRSKASIQTWRCMYKLSRYKDGKSYSEIVYHMNKRRMKFYNQGMTDKEIAQKEGKKEGSIQKWRLKRKLQPNKKKKISNKKKGTHYKVRPRQTPTKSIRHIDKDDFRKVFVKKTRRFAYDGIVRYIYLTLPPNKVVKIGRFTEEVRRIYDISKMEAGKLIDNAIMWLMENGYVEHSLTNDNYYVLTKTDINPSHPFLQVNYEITNFIPKNLNNRPDVQIFSVDMFREVSIHGEYPAYDGIVRLIYFNLPDQIITKFDTKENKVSMKGLIRLVENIYKFENKTAEQLSTSAINHLISIDLVGKLHDEVWKKHFDTSRILKGNIPTIPEYLEEKM